MDKVSATPYGKSACRIPAQLMPSTDSSYHDDLQMEWEHSLDDFGKFRKSLLRVISLTSLQIESSSLQTSKAIDGKQMTMYNNGQVEPDFHLSEHTILVS